MTRIGITGHMNLAPATVERVREALKAELATCEPGDLVGVTCLAEGADSLFAEAVLDAGGRLEVLLPAPDYRDTRVSERHGPVFDALLERAHEVEYVADHSSMDNYAQANAAMLDRVELLFAVWDGEPSAKTGGTADAVQVARDLDVPIKVIWPDGAERA